MTNHPDAMCPSRVLKEAHRMLALMPIADAEQEDDLIAVLHELEVLHMRIQKSGITWIKADGTHNG